MSRTNHNPKPPPKKPDPATPSEDDKFLPDAKRHALLDVISGELAGAHCEADFEVLGHKYRLRTLDPQEEAWADRYVDGQNFYQTAKNRRAPYVAAALVGVYGPDSETKEERLFRVDELFTPSDDMPDIQRALIDSNSEFYATWLRDEVLKWLVAKDKHGPYVQQLYARFLELEQMRNEALENLDPLSRGRDGKLSSTSLLGKASSSTTPASNE